VLFDENMIHLIMKADKPGPLVVELCTAYFKRMKILNNFEQVEIMLIADAMLYIIIFAKEELNLSDHKAGILLSILESLFKNDNPSYEKEPDQKEENIQEKYDTKYCAPSNSIENKNLASD